MSQAAGGGCWVRAGGLGAQGPSGSTRCRADGSCLSGAALWVTQCTVGTCHRADVMCLS